MPVVLVVSNFGRRTGLHLDSLSEANLINVADEGIVVVVVVAQLELTIDLQELQELGWKLLLVMAHVAVVGSKELAFDLQS